MWIAHVYIIESKNTHTLCAKELPEERYVKLEGHDTDLTMEKRGGVGHRNSLFHQSKRIVCFYSQTSTLTTDHIAINFPITDKTLGLSSS